METWKPLSRFDGIIEVSDAGGVRRISTMVPCKGGHKRCAPARTFKPRRHPWGYHWYEFSVAGKKYWDFAHRLVLEAFVGPCPKGYYALHFDNDPSNNRLDNLRYGTPAENCGDKLMHGTQRTGEQINWHKLKENQIVSIRCRRANGERLSDIGSDYGLSEAYVWHICTGKKWPNAGGPIEGKVRNVNILDSGQRLEALKLRADGWGIHRIAVRFGVSNTQIHNLVKKHENKVN